VKAFYRRHRLGVHASAAIVAMSTTAAALAVVAAWPGWYVPVLDFTLDAAREYGAVASFVAAVMLLMLLALARFDVAVQKARVAEMEAELAAERRTNALLRNQLAEHVDMHDPAWARLRREVEDARDLL